MVSKEDARELIAERDEIDKKLVENRLVLETVSPFLNFTYLY